MKRLCVKSTIALILLAVSLVFAFSACSSPIVEELVPQAKLLSLSIRTPSGNIAVSVIPEPISREDWDNEEYEVAAAGFGTIPVKQAEDTDRVRVTAVVSPGARVVWGTARSGNRPDRFTDPRVEASFTIDDFLYFKVTADDGKMINYYRYYPIIASPVKELAEMSIAGRDATKVPTPAASMETLVASVAVDNTNFYGQVDITVREAARAAVLAVPQDATAKIRYALAPSVALATQYGDFQDSNVLTFEDGNILFVEVTAQNGSDINYYAFRVTAGRIATIAKLELDGVEVVGKGTPMRQWAQVTQGSFASADQKTGGFTIQIQLDDPDAVYDYVLVTNTGSSTVPASGWDRTGPVQFGNGNQLGIRVRPARTTGEDSPDMRFYKIQVNLLAANFREQPKSDYYYYYNANTMVGDGSEAINWYNYVGLTVDPNHPNFTTKGVNQVQELGFVLDRSGTFTYQWYEANSWYGGYGFDADGRILYYKYEGADPTPEGDFSADAYHQDHFDEKRNVSLHNGGNTFYNLPIPGRIIPGATGATYKPQVNKRPFIAGFTSETHYYWVEITDSAGLKVTSKRAAIVSEWDPAKEHHIVNLNAYLDSTGRTAGLQDNPRNPTPFKDGNHGDKYAMAINFPEGFDIKKYSVVTCQALFYLADGREWIQNWTQGDFGFEDDKKERLVLWYNLTNDNATRGLDGSGNDPQGSGLDEIPAYVIVQPAGTKPLKQMPPFQANGQPVNTGDAQGWFTPYIEIVELRFEGPPRN